MKAPPPPRRVLIAGCGYVGAPLGALLAAQGLAVWGLNRAPRTLPPGVTPLRADLTRPAQLEGLLPADLDAVVFLVSPSEGTEAAYSEAYLEAQRCLLAALPAPEARPLRWILATSTAVYAQRGGAWVDERSPTEPTRFQGRVLLQAEALAAASGHRVTAVRFGGIYGPGRARIIEGVQDGTTPIYLGSPEYRNRIHRDDCAGLLAHLLQLPDPPPCLVAVDDDPAPMPVVINWLVTRLRARTPTVLPASRRLRTARKDNKRGRNTLLHDLGYTLRYPTYKEGFASIIEGAPGPKGRR